MTVPVDPELEITEIANRIVKACGSALLFENVKGASYPMAINPYGKIRTPKTPKKIAQAVEFGKLPRCDEKVLTSLRSI